VTADPEAVQSAARGVLRLWGGYSLADPWALALLPLAAGLLAWGRARAGRARGRAPLLPEPQLRTARQRFLWVPPALEGAALTAAILALARPLLCDVRTDVVSEGVDIALVVDRSSSMQFDDLERGRTRLEVVKDVVAEFAARRMTDRVGASDNVALITFARYPRLLCPFTLDVDALHGFLRQVRMAELKQEDGTAIGDALAEAVAALRASSARSKVVVLLTDGQNNVDDITPADAARLALESGIRVHTVFAAKNDYRLDPFLGRYVAVDSQVDTSVLEQIARTTGGRSFRAGDRAELERVYADIESLERTPRHEQRTEEAYDLYPAWLGAALATYLLGWLSSSTWARRIA
jgi:Ca-activated chloride channel family protein